MGERYFITGVQLGMLKHYVEQNMKGCALVLVDEIIDKQFTGNIQPRPEVEPYLTSAQIREAGDRALREAEIEKP